VKIVGLNLMADFVEHGLVLPPGFFHFWTSSVIFIPKDYYF